MIYRIFPSQDTWITNYLRFNVAQSASNHGGDEVLEIFKQYPFYNALTASLARSLIQFDLSQYTAITGSNLMGPVTWRLKMFDARHCGTQPQGYNLEVQALSQSWAEGNGLDFDGFSDLGYANWVQPTSNTYWTNQGGDVVGPTASFFVNTGPEDLELDVTTIVNNWLSGTYANNGFRVRIASASESDGLDYYRKEFFSSKTNTGKLPYLEASWDDSLKDDRNNFVFDYPNTLFLYNSVRGQLTNLPGVGTGNLLVNIQDLSGTLLTVTASYTGQTGIYSASVTIPTGSYSGSLFSDIWYSGSKTFMTGNFVPTDNFSQPVLRPDQHYYVNVTNLKDQYDTSEVVDLNLFVRDRFFNPTVVLTASSDSLPMVVTKGYYSIRNDVTDSIVVPFGTGTVETTRLSYDDHGNYFKFYMKNLPSGGVYRLVFLFVVDGQNRFVDGDFKFKVVSS